jgi:hypothetical protein
MGLARGLWLAIGLGLGCGSVAAGCSYDVPGVAPAARDASADTMARDALASDAPTLHDSSSPDSTVPPDALDASLDGALDGPVCSGPIAWKQTTTFSSPGATTLTLPGSSVVAPGDLLLVYLAAGGLSSAPAVVTAPAGWSLVGRANQADGLGYVYFLAVYSHVAVAGEATSYSWSAGTAVRAACWLLDYSGVDPAHPIDTQATAAQAVGSPPYGTPAIVTAGPNEVVIASYGAQVQHQGATLAWETPARMVQRAFASDGNQHSGSSDDELQPEAGAAGPFLAEPQSSGGNVTASSVITQAAALRPCP